MKTIKHKRSSLGRKTICDTKGHEENWINLGLNTRYCLRCKRMYWVMPS